MRRLTVMVIEFSNYLYVDLIFILLNYNLWIMRHFIPAFRSRNFICTVVVLLLKRVSSLESPELVLESLTSLGALFFLTYIQNMCGSCYVVVNVVTVHQPYSYCHPHSVDCL